MSGVAPHTTRHAQVIISRQICWEKKCIMAFSTKARSNNDKKTEGNPQRGYQNVSQNIHPSARKRELGKPIGQKGTKQTPNYIKSSFDVTVESELESRLKKDKIPRDYSMIYNDTFQRNSLIRNTCSKIGLCAVEALLIDTLIKKYQNMTNAGVDPFTLYPLNYDNLSFLGTSVAVALAPFVLGLILIDDKKRILRIYKENNKQENKYIVVKTHWVFWTKQKHFTDKDIEYCQDWETSILGLIAGNVRIKGARYRVSADCFREYSGYNEFLGFVPTVSEE